MTCRGHVHLQLVRAIGVVITRVTSHLHITQARLNNNDLTNRRSTNGSTAYAQIHSKRFSNSNLVIELHYYKCRFAKQLQLLNNTYTKTRSVRSTCAHLHDRLVSAGILVTELIGGASLSHVIHVLEALQMFVSFAVKLEVGLEIGLVLAKVAHVRVAKHGHTAARLLGAVKLNMVMQLLKQVTRVGVTYHTRKQPTTLR